MKTMSLEAIESVVGLPLLLLMTAAVLWLLWETARELEAKAALSRLRWGVGVALGGVGLYFGLGGLVMLVGRAASTPFGSLLGWIFGAVSVVIGALLLLLLLRDMLAGFRRPTFVAIQGSGKNKPHGV